jgi:hypothetical protein
MVPLHRRQAAITAFAVMTGFRAAISLECIVGWIRIPRILFESPIQENCKMKLNKLALSLLLGVAMAGMTFAVAQDNGAKQDMKNAGHDTKQAAKDTGNATKKTAKKAGHTAKKTTNKAAGKTKQGAAKVQNKTQNTANPQ